MSGGILNTLFALLFAVTLLAFFWGLVMYVAELGSQEAKIEYKSVIVGSITALFLLMCLYAVIEWLGGLLGL